jgi:hypothetical protein
MKKVLLLLLLVNTSFSNAQDSIIQTQDPISQKRITHELGFNSVLLIKQIISNNPATTLPQLPYQVIYTMHFNNKFGIRAGLGINQSRTETTISGLTGPRVTKTISGAYRFGVNRNFLNFKKITCNAFADMTFTHANITTDTESSSGTFSSKTSISSKSMSVGPEIGFGIKYSFNKHIALYTEIPLQVTYNQSHDSETQSSFSNGTLVNTTSTISDSKGYSTRIFLPTTLFLNILF